VQLLQMGCASDAGEEDCRVATNNLANDVPGSDEDNQPLLTVIVPVYNERATVDRLLRRVVVTPYSKQVVVVDDGSTDGTAELLAKWRGSGRIELLTHAHNQGKGAAIRTGLARARGQFTIIQDADLEYDPQDYERVVQPLLEGRADVVFGSRRLGATHAWRQLFNPFYHGVTVLNLAVRILYGARITDEATCYKVFPTAVLRALDPRCVRFEFCPEVTAKACRMGLKIVEVPIHYAARSKRAGKKIGPRDAIEALRTLWHWRRWKPPPRTGAPGLRSDQINAAKKNGITLLKNKPRREDQESESGPSSVARRTSCPHSRMAHDA